MKMRSLALGLCSVMVFLCTLFAYAGETETQISWSGGYWLDVSGFEGEEKFSWQATANHALVGLRWWEKEDKPYTIASYYRQLCDETQTCKDEWSDPMPYDYSEFKSGHTALLNADLYVTAIQVCTTDKKNTAENRIKGIRVWGARINKEGQFEASDKMVEAKLTNCSQWRTKRSCTSGSVAIGYSVYHERQDYGALTGIKLQCAKLTIPHK